MKRQTKLDANPKITRQINPETSSIFARPRHITDFQTDYKNVQRYFPLTSKKYFKETIENFRRLTK